MKKALDAYRDLLKELDRTESPSFNIRAFNYWINSGIDEYIAKEYEAYPVVQKSVDKLRSIAKHSPLSFVNLEADLPTDYRHMLNVEVTVKFLVNSGRFHKDDVAKIYPEREKSGSEGYNQNNAFHRPSYKVPYYNILENKITLKIGNEVTALSALCDYLRVPDTVYLNPDKTSDYTLEANNTTLNYPINVYYDIIKETKRLVLENIESPRYQSSLQEEAMRP